jgi:hypothetical protein
MKKPPEVSGFFYATAPETLGYGSAPGKQLKQMAKYSDTTGDPMLSDVFFDRYESLTLWTVWRPSDRKLMMQCSQILADDLFPKMIRDRSDLNEHFWAKGSALLCREIGCASLSATRWQAANKSWWTYSYRDQCRNFLAALPAAQDDVDYFIKLRISLVELMFRLAAERIADSWATLANGNTWLSGDPSRDQHIFDSATVELNARMARSGAPLNYHNGFVQISRDPTIATQIEQPFWNLVDQPKWSNVDIEMKEAVDRRDSGSADAAFHAGKALESAIKVINEERGWLTGKERGGADHASNLWSAAGGRMLEEWQVQSIKHIFSKLRNPFGHGAGTSQPPSLTAAEVDWAISMCMAWISLMVRTHAETAHAV